MSNEKNNSNLIIESAGITEQQTIAEAAATDKYTHYDIELETQSQFEDALFGSEEELEQALANGLDTTSDNHVHKQPKPPVTQPDEEPKVDNHTIEPPPLHHFLSQHSLERKFKSGVNLFSGKGTHLPVSHKHSLPTEALVIPELVVCEQYLDIMPQAEMAELPSNRKDFKGLYRSASTLVKFQLDKAKLQIEESTGKSLPKRTVDFDYKPLKLKPEKSVEGLLSQYELNSQLEQKGLKPIQVLQLCASQLGLLNKCDLGLNKKRSRLDDINKHLLPTLNQLIQTFQKKALSAKNEHYSELSQLAKHCSKQILNAYKHLYLSLYLASDLHYATNRNTANELAFELAEWISLQQALHHALQLEQSKSSILLFSRLFMAIVQCEPLQAKKQRYSKLLNTDANMEQLFIRFTLLRFIDFSCINTRLHKEISKLLTSLCPLAKVISFAANIDRSEFFSQDINSKALPTLNQQYSAELISLHLSPVFIKLQTLYQASIDTLGSQNSKSQVFSALHATIKQLQQHLQNKATHRYNSYQPSDLSIFTALENCYNHDTHKYAKRLKNNDQQLEITLPPTPIASKTPCLLSGNIEQEFGIRLNEPKAKISANIGSPVIFSEKNSDNKIIGNTLTIVNAIDRKQPGSVDLSIEIVSKEYTGVVIESFLPPNNKGFLFRKDNKHYILCSNEAECWKGRVLDIRLHNSEPWIVCIKQLIQHYGEICIYELF